MMYRKAVAAMLAALWLAPLAWAEGDLQLAAGATSQVQGLPGALQAMRVHHPALRGKRAVVAAKEHLSDSVRAQRYPSLSAQATRQDNDVNPVTLRARQPLWAFGRIDSTIAAADADITTEKADLLRLERQLTDQTVTAYVKVQGVERRLHIAADNIVALELLHEQIQRREQGLLASQADVRLALARLVQARAQRERFDGELAVARSELEALTQLPVATIPAIPDALMRLPPLEILKNEAQEASADVRFQRQRVALADADVEREKLAPMPTVYLQADRAHNQPGYSRDTRVGIVIEGNFEGLGFAAAGRSAAAVARSQASREDLAVSHNDVHRVVHSLFANWRSQLALAGSQRTSVIELSEILASYQRQYEAGTKAWLDVLNMLRELTDQRLLEVQAETDWQTSSLRLAVLIGKLDDMATLAALADTPSTRVANDSVISKAIRRHREVDQRRPTSAAITGNVKGN